MNAPLRRCVGFVCSPARQQSWKPCTHPALPRDRFCLPHREGLNGALLGLAGIEEFQGISHATESQRPAKRKRKAKFSRASIYGGRALREGFPHLKLALRRLVADSKRRGEVAHKEIAEFEAKVDKKAPAESGVSLESRAAV